MTTYQQNNAAINGDTCAVSDEGRLIGLGSLLASSERIIRSGVVCNISQRILKIGQDGPLDLACLFTPLVKEMRIAVAPLQRVKMTSGTCLRTLRNFSSNFKAASAKPQSTFAKCVFGLIPGFNRRARILPIKQVFKLAGAV